MANESLPAEPRYLSRRDIARITASSLPTVDAWIHHEDEAKRLPSFRPGDGVKILVGLGEFTAWLDRNRTCGKAEVRQITGKRA